MPKMSPAKRRNTQARRRQRKPLIAQGRTRHQWNSKGELKRIR